VAALYLRAKESLSKKIADLNCLEGVRMSDETDVRIGKFDILAAYTYVKALLDGTPANEAKERGIVAAIMGANAKLGHTGSSRKDHQTDKTAAEQKKKTTITAETFDHQVVDKMGEFFDKTFLPAIKKMVKANMSYDEIKSRLKIPSTWGVKITGEQFKERATVDK
jgi:hypothetical protein